ncbi:helix-turn-helix domain-containing protein [Bacillus cereus]|uniref:helix-turn-helix domain-containing protein n=1 Tax=Bacillus cereus TaxID=1396 RepID=UPI003908361B
MNCCITIQRDERKVTIYYPTTKVHKKRLVYNRVVEMLNNGEAISCIAKENGITWQIIYRIKHVTSS